MSISLRTPTPTHAGVTLVELAVVVVMLGILASIAIPRAQDAVRQARATAVMGDMRTARLALFDYHTEHNTWPPDASPGDVPPGLAPYLPDGFSFEGEHALLDYVDLRAGEPGRWGENVGLTAYADGDPDLLRELLPVLAQMDPEAGERWIAVGVQEAETETENE